MSYDADPRTGLPLPAYGRAGMYDDAARTRAEIERQNARPRVQARAARADDDRKARRQAQRAARRRNR